MMFTRRIGYLPFLFVFLAGTCSQSPEPPSPPVRPILRSLETGSVPLVSLGGNTPNPYFGEPPTRLYLELAEPSARTLFGQLALRHTRIASAIIDDEADHVKYLMHDVIVTGVAVEAGTGGRPQHVRVTLAVKQLSVSAVHL